MAPGSASVERGRVSEEYRVKEKKSEAWRGCIYSRWKWETAVTGGALQLAWCGDGFDEPGVPEI